MSDLEDDAAEYVLGTLDQAERVVFARRLAADPAVRRAVVDWERRLAGLAGGVPPIVPPPSVWAGIERALEQAAAGASSRFKMIEGGAATRPPRLLQSLWLWQAATIASTGLAAVLLVLLVSRGLSPSAEEASFVAAVSRGGSKPALLVRVDLRTHSVVVRPIAAETPSGKSLQLWYIGAGQSPRSMGVVDQAPASLPVPASFPLGQEARAIAATFAVTVEPPGGSKSGGPTGPVIYSGELIKE